MKTIRIALLSLALLAGCSAPVPPQTPATSAPASELGDAWYVKAAAAGQKIYRIDTAQSLIAVTVRRGGAFARFGHDHVVASRSVSGYAAPDAGRADFRFRLDQMTVDEAALRSEAGLDTQPDADAIAGTRNNMLTRVLEADKFPVVSLHAEPVPGKPETLRLSVILHGVTRSVDVPTNIERSAGRLVASGTLTLKQTDFGITPMSVMGGAMTVQDPMELRFRIIAAPLR